MQFKNIPLEVTTPILRVTVTQSLLRGEFVVWSTLGENTSSLTKGPSTAMSIQYFTITPQTLHLLLLS